MPMKKSLHPLLIVFTSAAILIIATTQAKQKEIVLENMPAYQDSIRIDGDISDWLSQQLPVIKKNKVAYAITTDSSAVMLLLISNDRPTTMKILHRGLNIFIDSKGKKSKDAGIAFPLQQRRDSIRPNAPINRDEIFAAMDKRITELVHLAADSIIVFGCRQEFNGRFKTGQAAVQATVAKSGKDSLIIELKIPFDIFPDIPKQGKPFSVGFEIPAMNEEGDFPPMDGAPGFDPPPMPADMPPPPGGQWNDEPFEFWIKYTWPK